MASGTIARLDEKLEETIKAVVELTTLLAVSQEQHKNVKGTIENQEERIKSLEACRDKSLGAMAVLALVGGFVWWIIQKLLTDVTSK